jgi:hypothetical protein
MPSAEALLDAIRKDVDECSKQGLFAKPPVTELTTEVRLKKQGAKQAEDESSDEATDE